MGRLGQKTRCAATMAVGSAVAAMALAGCGSSSPFSMTKAYGDTVAAKTAKVTFVAAVAGSSGGTSVSTHVTGSGVMDLNGSSADITLSLPDNAGAFEERVLGQNIYMHFPSSLLGGQSGLPAGKSWISVNLTQALGPGATSMMQSAEQENPADFLNELDSKSSKVTDLGSATIDGVSTTHYRATIDAAAQAKKLAQSQGATALAKKAAAQDAKLTSVPVDVWVDSSGRLRQFKMNLSESSSKVAITMDLTDFGTPVDVTAPSPSETFDVTSQAINGAAQAGSASGSSSSG